MSKYYGKIGFAVDNEIEPGYFEPSIVERSYIGDVLENNRRFDQGDTISGELTINNKFSIIADPYVNENLASIRYITWMGSKWTITNVTVSFPRLILTVGGQYNG